MGQVQAIVHQHIVNCLVKGERVSARTETNATARRQSKHTPILTHSSRSAPLWDPWAHKKRVAGVLAADGTFTTTTAGEVYDEYAKLRMNAHDTPPLVEYDSDTPSAEYDGPLHWDPDPPSLTT